MDAEDDKEGIRVGKEDADGITSLDHRLNRSANPTGGVTQISWSVIDMWSSEKVNE